MLDFKIITLSSNTRVPTMIPCSKYSGKLSLELPYESYVNLAFKKIHFICFKSLCYTKVHHPACMWGAGQMSTSGIPLRSLFEMGTTIP